MGEARSANKVTAIEKGTVSANQPAFEVFLDGKPIKTPLKRPLVLPTKRLAMMVAAEWEMQVSREPEGKGIGFHIFHHIEKVFGDIHYAIDWPCYYSN